MVMILSFLSNYSKIMKCIWDNGGNDTISAAFSLQSVNIDLRNASLQNQVGGGGYVSQVGSESKGYTIAYNSTGNCIIENETGSNYNDVLKGNSFANVLISFYKD